MYLIMSLDIKQLLPFIYSFYFLTYVQLIEQHSLIHVSTRRFGWGMFVSTVGNVSNYCSNKMEDCINKRKETIKTSV